jgi:CHAT domain-containing protein/Tfp pilus assembly protein PilF
MSRLRLSFLALLALTFGVHAQTERTVYDSFIRANALKEAFKFDEAEAEYQRCLPMALKVHGEEHKTTLALFLAMGDLHERQGKFAEAEKDYARHLQIREKLNGPESLETATAITNLAAVEIELAKFDEAGKHLSRTLKIREKAGEETAAVADTLNDLATLASRQGKPEEAEKLYRRSLIIRNKTDGPESAIVAQSLSNLGLVLHDLEKHVEAEQMHRRALEIREKVRGVDHPTTAESLNNLAILLRDLGRYTEAEELHKRALKIRETALGSEHVRTISTVNNLAIVLQDQGRYIEAEGMFLRALAVQFRIHGAGHPVIAEEVINLAGMYKAWGRFSDAERLYRQALDRFEKSLGATNPIVSDAATSLAMFLDDQGRFAEAEPFYRQALVIREKQLGPEHPLVAATLTQLGNAVVSRGQPAEGKASLVRALAIREKLFGAEHPAFAESLNALAICLQKMGSGQEAVAAFNRSLAVREKVFGKDHEASGDALYNRAKCRQDFGQIAEAEADYRQALAVYEKALGKDHPHNGEVLTQFANMLTAAGRLDQAREARQRARDIAQRAFGLDHPTTAAVIDSLASNAWKEGKLADAAKLFDEQRRATRRYVIREFSYLTEAEQRKYIAGDSEFFGRALALGLDQSNDADMVRRSAEWLINGKALALEARTLRFRVNREAESTVRVAMLDLQDAHAREAALAQRQSGPAAPAVQAQRIQAFRVRRELEQKIVVPTAMLFQPWIDLDAVRQTVPADGLLVDIALVRQSASAALHYVAWVIPPADKGDVTIVDLGEATAINANIHNVRDALEAAPKRASQVGEAKAEAETREVLGKLADRLLKPLGDHLKGVKTLIVSPDGDMWLAPWAALPIDPEKYLVEAIAPRFVLSSRDLVRPAGSKVETTPALILADADFDAAPVAGKIHVNNREARGTLTDFDVAFRFREDGRLVVRLPDGDVIGQGIWRQDGDIVTAETATSIYKGRIAGRYLRGERRFKAKAGNQPDVFALELVDPPPQALLAAIPRGSRMPWTKTEAEMAAARLKKLTGSEAVTLLDARASEAALKAASSPRVLVLATQGFVLPPSKDEPLARTGFLLAGVNKRASAIAGQEDGVLTGTEILGLDLRGTSLVVLSGCDTPVDGHAVSELRQAFQLAGAGDVLASLWPVPDAATARLTARFYDHVGDGANRATALAEAQRESIRNRRKENSAAHPYLWAALTITGKE